MSIWRWVVVAAGMTVLMLLATLPAAWVWQQGSGAWPQPPGLAVSAVRGSVWAGRATFGLGMPQGTGTRIDLEFHADAACWLRLQPGYRLRLRGENAEVRLRVCRASPLADAGWEVIGAGQLPAAWLIALHAASGAAPPPLQLQGSLEIERLEVFWQGSGRRGGSLALLELSAHMEQPLFALTLQPAAPPLALGPLKLWVGVPGSLAAEAGGGSEGGTPVVNLGGAGPAQAEAIWLRVQEGVSVDGRPAASMLGLDLSLARTESGLRLSGSLKPAETLPQLYRDWLGLLGSPDSQGRYLIQQRLRSPAWLPPPP